MNSFLRRGNLLDADERSLNLQTTILDAPSTDKDIVLFRLLYDMKFINGDLFHSRGFMSCTDRYSSVIKEASLKKKIIAQVSIPKGTNILYYDSREREYILPHDIYFNVRYKGFLNYLINDKIYEIESVILDLII